MRQSMSLVLAIFAILILFSNASYGSLTTDPMEAYSFLDPSSPNYIEDAFLIDVRRPSEWLTDGHPGMNVLGEGDFLDGKVFNIAWVDDSWQSNENFFDEVSSLFGWGDTLIIMCKSGVRSTSATAALLSLETDKNMTLYNMLSGFNGWKAAGLPYNLDSEGAWEPGCPVPVPSSILMLAPGLIGLIAGFRRRKL